MKFSVYFYIHYLLFFLGSFYSLIFIFDHSSGSHVDFYVRSASLSAFGLAGYFYLLLFSSKPVINNIFFTFVLAIFQILHFFNYRKEVIFTNTLIGRMNMSHLLFTSFSWVYLGIMPFINKLVYRQKQLDNIQILRDKLLISNHIDEQIDGQWI